MNGRETWCRTNFVGQGPKAKSVDHVCAALALGFRCTERVVLNLLQDRQTCTEYLSKLSHAGISSLDVISQENLLTFMIGNASIFSQHRLDDVIVSYIEMTSVTRKSQFLILLAQQVLLNWILSQSTLLFDDMQSIRLLRALEGHDSKKQKSDTFDQRSRSRKMKYGTFASIGDTVDVLPRKKSYIDDPDICNSFSIQSEKYGSTKTADIYVNTSPVPSDSSILMDFADFNEDFAIYSQPLKAQEVEVIVSSIRAISWLDINNSSRNSRCKSNSINSQNLISMGCSTTGEAMSNVAINGCIKTIQVDHMDKRQEEEEEILSRRGSVSDIVSTTVPMMLVIEVEKGLPVSNMAIAEIKQQVVSSATVLPKTTAPELAMEMTNIIQISAIEERSSSHKSNRFPSDGSSDEAAENAQHAELLTSCRTHRACVLKSSSSIGTASLSPKVVQQLSQSAAILLANIGNFKCTDPASNSRAGSQMSPSQSSTQPLSHIDETIDEINKFSLNCLQLQARALLALSLHEASDDIIAAVSELLLSKVGSGGKQSEWHQEQIQPQTAVLFLSGVLLTRIRLLTSPASRWLLRAIEVSVRNTPDLVIRCVLSMIVGSGFGAALAPSNPQYELLQRVSRQVLTGDQCDELVYHLCSYSSKSAKSENVMQSAALVLDALISSVYAIVVPGGSKLQGEKSVGGRKPGTSGQNSSAKTLKRAEGRNIGIELQKADQDIHYCQWSVSVSSVLHVTGDDESNHSWTVSELAGKLKENISNSDSELLKTINTVLNLMPRLSCKTARSLLDHMDNLSNALAQSTKEIGIGVAAGTGKKSRVLGGSSSSGTISNNANSSAAIIALIYTITVKFSETVNEGAALKRDALAILARLASTAVSKAAAAALNKLH